MATAVSQWSSDVPLCDIGVNLTDPVFRGVYHGKRKHADDLEAVLTRAADAGVKHIIVTAGNLQESRDALELVSARSQLTATAGVHPTRCGEIDAHAEGPDAYFEALAAHIHTGKGTGKIVAIGECGLDYDRTHFCAPDVQRKYFARHFALAREFGLPMFLHNRNTGGDFGTIVREHGGAWLRGVAHSFTGPLEEARELLDLGLFIGINGCSLKTEENLAVLREIPTDRLMLETDAPWCEIRPTHASHRHVRSSWPTKKVERADGTSCVKGRCEPCHMRQVLEVVAAEKEEDLIDLAQQVWDNTRRLFFTHGSA